MSFYSHFSFYDLNSNKINSNKYMHDVNIIKKNVGVLAAFYSKSPTTPCSIFLGHIAVSTPTFFFNFADIFLISPTSDQ